MFKNVIFSVILVLMSAVSAQGNSEGGCDLSQVGAVEVSWTAYKTPSKVGVSGVFESVKYTPIAPIGKNFRSILVGSTVTIDTTSINSKNSGRDDKLIEFFFGEISRKNIEAKIIDIKADEKVKDAPRTGVVTIEIDMNGELNKVPMKYSFSDGVFSATGVIDILDFSAGDALSSINKACSDLHEGKTWSDVTIGFTTKIEAVLCSAKPLK